MSKYQPLADFLRNSTSEVVRLSFTEVENIISNNLPRSALIHNAWWSNSRTNDTHTWAHLWIEAGWEREQLNLPEQWVVFRRFQYFDIESPQAVEGYEIDRKILIRGRSADLAAQRKELDKYTCQVCGFHLQFEGRYVIEVHHCEPLSASGEVTTTIDKLISLCPTCHRIAHLRNRPYSVAEIKAIRALLP